MITETKNIGTVTTVSGAESTPLGGWPNQKLFIASDGRVILLHSQLSGWFNTRRFTFGWQESDETQTTWTSKTIEHISCLASTSSYIQGITGWIDANDTVHVAYYTNQSATDPRTNRGVVKVARLVKDRNTGWAVDTTNTIVDSVFPESASITVCPGSRRVWLFLAVYDPTTLERTYRSYYSSEDGDPLQLGPDFGVAPNYPSPPISAVAWGTRVLVVRKLANGQITASEHEDQYSEFSWFSDKILWQPTDINLTDTWQHGLTLRYCGHGDATAVAICRDSHGFGRIKRYKEGRGWYDTECVYGFGIGQNETHNSWDPVRRRLLVWYSQYNTPFAYNPTDETISDTVYPAHQQTTSNVTWGGLFTGRQGTFGSWTFGANSVLSSTAVSALTLVKGFSPYSAALGYIPVRQSQLGLDVSQFITSSSTSLTSSSTTVTSSSSTTSSSKIGRAHV